MGNLLLCTSHGRRIENGMYYLRSKPADAIKFTVKNAQTNMSRA